MAKKRKKMSESEETQPTVEAIEPTVEPTVEQPSYINELTTIMVELSKSKNWRDRRAANLIREAVRVINI